MFLVPANIILVRAYASELAKWRHHTKTIASCSFLRLEYLDLSRLPSHGGFFFIAEPVATGTKSSIMIVAWFLIFTAMSRASVHQARSQGSIEQFNNIGVAPTSNIAEPARSADQIPKSAHKALARRVVLKAQCGAPIPPRLITSCREAFDFLPDTGPEVISFGQRALKGQVDHVTPFLIMSCKAARLLPSYKKKRDALLHLIMTR